MALPDPRVEVAWLRAFVAVARNGSVGSAAVALGRTQPTVSSRIASLERTWSTRLFRRGARGMTLTPEGRRLLPPAEGALESLQRLDREAGLAAGVPSELRLGAGDALGRARLPRAVSALLRERPDLEIHVRESPGPGLLEALREGRIDLALIVATPGSTPPGVETRPLLETTVDLLRPPTEDLASNRPGLAELQGRRLVTLQRDSAFRRHLELAHEALGLRLHATVEVGNLSLVRRFVSAGLGLGPVPAVAFPADDPLPGIERLPLGDVPAVSYRAAWREGTPLNPVQHRLLDLLVDGV